MSVLIIKNFLLLLQRRREKVFCIVSASVDDVKGTGSGKKILRKERTFVCAENFPWVPQHSLSAKQKRSMKKVF